MQNTRYSCQILMELQFSRYCFRKYIKFHENPSSGGRDVPCGRTNVQMDMTKLTVACTDFANASKTDRKVKEFCAMQILYSTIRKKKITVLHKAIRV
jgi:hypothetical protein